MISRSFLALLLLCSFLLLAGCNNKDEESPITDIISGDNKTSSTVAEDEVEQYGVISLSVDRADGLNPFKLTTQNNNIIMPLIYESLYILDESFSAVPLLASEAKFAEKSCTITLKNGIVFSDGSPITIEDVYYSFLLASSSPAYSNLLNGITADFSGENRNSITFSYGEKDVLFTSLLTFPVVKRGTEEDDIPIGSGAYRPDGETLLVAADETAKIREIKLINPPKTETIAYAIRSKMLDIYFLDYNNEQDYSIATQTRKIPSNHLVYLGLNQNSLPCSSQEFRKALYSIINRSQIVETVYRGKGTVTFTPINPAVSWLPPMEFGNSNFNVNDLAGNSLSFEDNKLLLNEERITVSLLVNSENTKRIAAAEVIKESLEKYSIGVEIKSLPFASYTAAIRSGDFDLYLGEVQLKNNMSLEPFFSGGIEGNVNSTGLTISDELSNKYQSFRSNLNKTDEFLLAFLDNPPFIPLLYRDNAVAISKDIPSYAKFSPQNILYSTFTEE